MKRRGRAPIDLSDEDLRSEARYRRLFQAHPQPMWVYDLETLRFLAVNDAAVHHYGYSQDEFAGLTIRDIRPREDVPLLLANVAHAPQGPRFAAVALDLLLPDGKPVLVVEDDPAALRLAQAALGGLGYRVRAAGTGEEGLCAAAEEPPSAVAEALPRGAAGAEP